MTEHIKVPKIHNHFDQKEIEDAKELAAIGYLGILCLLPLLLKKNNKFAQAHGKQALVLCIAEFIIMFINIIPILGQLVWLVATIVFVFVSIKSLLTALRGDFWEIPYIYEYSKKIKI